MIEMSNDSASVAAQVVGVGLEFVQLLDDVEGDNDLVVAEEEDRVGVVQEDVGVDDEGFYVAVIAHARAEVVSSPEPVASRDERL